MTREDAILHMTLRREELKLSVGDLDEDIKAFDMAIEALEQEPCEMTAEEYRQRMIQAFHNAGTDELIAVCVLPTAKEFEYLEWLLKNHYKKEPCDDAISRQAVIDATTKYCVLYDLRELLADIETLPSINVAEKTGRWKWNQYDYNPNLGNWHCSECGSIAIECVPKKGPSGVPLYKYCPQCGCRLMEV